MDVFNQISIIWTFRLFLIFTLINNTVINTLMDKSLFACVIRNPRLGITDSEGVDTSEVFNAYPTLVLLQGGWAVSLYAEKGDTSGFCGEELSSHSRSWWFSSWSQRPNHKEGVSSPAGWTPCTAPRSQLALGAARDSSRLTRPQVTLTLIVWGPHYETVTPAITGFPTFRQLC